MGRYSGPVCKLCRREGERLLLKGSRCETPKCAMTKRAFPPGQAGVGRRKKLSEYGIRLREKQKARRFYGLSESQFKRIYDKAVAKKGIKGENFLKALESRFDNVIYRLELASSRRQARQLIKHGHFMVNGRLVDIPSYVMRENDKITIGDKSAKLFDVAIELLAKKTIPGWLSFDSNTKEATIVKVPIREDIDIPVNEQLIVEFYSR